MYAFVQNVGLLTNRSNLPHSGLQSICNTKNVSNQTLNNKHSTSSCNVQMSWASDTSITLDTLVYWPNPTISGVEDKDQICYNVWKQVFGNAYVMESEREEGYIYESSFRSGDITLREFIRGLALSSTYKRRFFDCCSPYRAVELNFKHLLGRGPNSQEELSKHIQIIANQGYEAEINSYIDSIEYEEEFGDDIVPYIKFKGTYSSIEHFNRMCVLYSAHGTTDKSLTKKALNSGIQNPNFVLSLDGAGYTSRLVGTITNNTPSSHINIKKAIPSRPDLDLGTATIGRTDEMMNPNATVKKRFEIVPGSYMYLTEEEAKAYKQESFSSDKVVALAESEISAAQMQIKLLEEKIAELSLIK